jgi:hypothetical protein
MKRITLLALVGLALIVGPVLAVALWNLSGARPIAIACDDMPNRPGWAKAVVYLQNTGYGKAVWLKVLFERHGKEYIYGRRTLGYVQSQSEAVDKWGRIDWKSDGVHIGSGSNVFVVSRAELDH